PLYHARMTRISRRDFARTVGVAAGAMLLPSGARGGEKPKIPTAPSPPPSKLPAASQAEADARVQMIVGRYGARLSPAERAELARLSHDAQEQLDKLRAFTLDVTDEPAHIFRAPRRRR
ncbi:MAG: hypothetical protein LC659_04710, partial [Myxococcales bacterium]|nr:hypothetical protein [Myxococcales bacterium]